MKNLSRLGLITIMAPVAVVVFVNPISLYDPFSVLRLLVLTSFGFVSLGFIAYRKEFNFSFQKNKLLYLIPAFVLWSLLSLLFSGNNFSQGLFGVTGRNTGFLAYLNLAILLLGAVLSVNLYILKILSISLLGLAGLTSVYGVFQSINLDPIDWVNNHSPVFGVFGNPNFHSAFLAMALSVAFVILISPNQRVKFRLLMVVLIALFIYNVIASKAQQGVLAFGAGMSVVGLAYILTIRKSRILLVSYVILASISIFAVLLDIFQKSPWTPILYKASVSERGDLWRAGWKIMVDNPLFGVGLDQYRDYYARYRDIDAILRIDSKSSSSSAHNILLDLGAGGGFVLMLLYLSLVIVALISMFRVLKRETNWNTYFVAICSAWIAFQAQSFISVGQIALTVWGWILTGLIIGYELKTRENTTFELNRRKVKYSLPAILTIGTMGFALALQPVINDYQYRQNLKTGNVLEIEKSLKRWPQNVVYMIQMAKMMREAKLEANSYNLITSAVKFNPHYLEAWNELSLNPKISAIEKATAKQMIHKLDPYNPANK